MERHRNWIKLKVVLSAISIMSFCAVYLSMIEATSKTTTKVITSDGTHTSSLDSLRQEATYRQSERYKALLGSSNNNLSIITQPSKEKKGYLAIYNTSSDRVSSDNPQDVVTKCTSSACQKKDKKRTKQRLAVLGMPRGLSTDPQGNNTQQSQPEIGSAKLMSAIKTLRKRLKGGQQHRPKERSRKTKGRTRRDTLSAALKPSSPGPSGLPSELRIRATDSPLVGKAETMTQRPGELPAVSLPDKKPFRPGKLGVAGATPAKQSSEPSGSSRRVDPSPNPSQQTITGMPLVPDNVDKSVRDKPQASEAHLPRPSPSSSSTHSFPHTTSNYLLPVHVTQQLSSGDAAHVQARTITEGEVQHSPTSQPVTTPRQINPSITMPHKDNPKLQRTEDSGVHHSTSRFIQTSHPETVLPVGFNKGSSPAMPMPTTNGSDIQDIEERTSGSECRNGLSCNAVLGQRTDDAYWAFGSLLTILMLLTGCILYTGLWKKRNHMSNPISDVSCHAQAQASPSRKTNIRDLLKHKLSHIKNLNNSPLSLGKADWKRCSNGSSSSSNGRYLHRYDRLPLLVRGEEDDDEEEEEFSREWGLSPQEQTCGV